MALTYGFYNSLNGDRKHNAAEMSRLFDGIINDGVFMSIGTALMVTEDTGMAVNVGIGRAWFNSTWTYNNSLLHLELDVSEVVLNRIDTVVLEVDHRDSSRKNSIKIVKGTPATIPTEPLLTKNDLVNQYPLAQIYVGKNVQNIIQANITNKIGTSETPFITGILETMDIDSLIAQWQSEFSSWIGIRQTDFDGWFLTLQDVLDENAAGNLLNMVNATNVRVTEIEKIIANYNSYASAKDTDGTFTIVEYKRADSTLYMKSILSNPNADNKYQKVTWQIYNILGTLVMETLIWTLTYDDDGNIISKEVS